MVPCNNFSDYKKNKNGICICLPLFIFCLGLSACNIPSLEDIEQLNDRSSPVFTIEYPSDGDAYEEIVRVKGEVIDNQGSENQTERIKTVTYQINGTSPEMEIPINDSGSFLISFSTFYYSGPLTLVFKATDISGNIGIKDIILTEAPPPTPEPEASPTPYPTSYVPDYSPGTLWFVPNELYTSGGENFSTEIHCNTGTQYLASYGLTLFYNISYIALNTTYAYNGVEAGPDGFISAINVNSSGTVTITGFDTSGTSPGSDRHILTIYWSATAPGNTYLSISVQNLTDNSAQTIGTPQGSDCTVVVE